MMRVLALALLLTNLCVWFWARYIDVNEAPVPSASAPPARTTLLLASERHSPSAADAAASTCLSVGPFADEAQVTAATARLKSAGLTGTPRSEDSEVFAGYWVYLEGFKQRADADKVLTKLHDAGISDAYVVNDETVANAISLGLFAEQANAEQRRLAIAKLNLNPQLRSRTRKGQSQWLDIALPTPGQRIDPGLLQPEAAGITRLETRPCPAPLP